MTNKDKILTYLRYIAPDRATNSDLRRQIGIQSHQQVYLPTQELMRERHFHGVQDGKEWIFRCDAGTSEELSWLTARERTNQNGNSGSVTPSEFEALARRAMGKHFGVTLKPGQVDGVPKTFDLVSPDGAIVGDAKYYTMVRGEGLPPAKFATIAEHVWLLEKTRAVRRFLVFGNDLRVPREWLKRYGHLLADVEFFFLHQDGQLDALNP